MYIFMHIPLYVALDLLQMVQLYLLLDDIHDYASVWAFLLSCNETIHKRIPMSLRMTKKIEHTSKVAHRQ